MAGAGDAPGAELSGAANNGTRSTSPGGAVGNASDADGAATSVGLPGVAADAQHVSGSSGSEEQGHEADAEPRPTKMSRSPAFWAIALGLITSFVLTALIGWQGFVAHQSHRDQQQRDLVIHAARQGALNLTTLDWENADADVQRILDSATGPFYEDFSKRMQPFVEVLKRAKSKSVGTITEAGLESESVGKAEVLVTVRIDTSNAGAAEAAPRHWRMRLSVEDIDNEFKISNVAFVP